MENLLEHFRDVMIGAAPDRDAGHAAASPAAAADDDDQLLRLLNEVTHSICRDEEAEGGFLVEETPPASYAVPPHYAAASPAGLFPFAAPSANGSASKPPPSFAEAIASTPPMTNRAELSPLAAHYVPPMPAAPHDPILVRNEHGVFLLQPIAKPTPPYTPPSVSPPISPLPRYALPPAAPPPPHFLGSSVAQAGGHAEAKKSPFSTAPSATSGSHVLNSGGAGAYTFSSTTVKASYTPPPPYPASMQ